MKEFKSIHNLQLLSRFSVFVVASAHTIYCLAFYLYDITALFYFKLAEAVASWSFFAIAFRLKNHQNFIIYFIRMSLFFSCTVCNIYLGNAYGFSAIMLVLIATGYMHNFKSDFIPKLTGFIELCVVCAAIAVAHFTPTYQSDLEPIMHIMGVFMCAATVLLYAKIADLINSQSSLSEHEKELSRKTLSESDRLVRLYNRAAMKEIMHSQLEYFQPEHGQVFCVALIDVDKIKKVNEKYGHRFGDMAIYNISELIRKAVLPHEGLIYAGRWSGQEFLISAIAGPGDDFCSLIDGIIASCARTTHSDGYHSARLGLSAGVLISARKDDIEAILHKTDTALYNAKRAGGARSSVLRLSAQ